MNKSILVISQLEYPLDSKVVDPFVKLFASAFKLCIASYKSHDTYNNKKIVYYGYSDSLFVKKPFIRSLINIIFVPKKNIGIIFSSHHEQVIGVYNVIFSKLYKKKSVVRIAGDLFNAYKYKRTMLNSLITFIVDRCIAIPILKYADVIIVMSEDMKKKFISRGYDPHKIRVIMQLTDYFDYDLNNHKVPYKCLKLKKNKRNVLFVGNLTKGKGIDTFIKLSKNKKIRENFHFILAGRDRDSYTEKLKSCSNITMLGKISRSLLLNYLYKVDLFFFPSYFEGFPKVITEAYGCGCPILARNIVNVDRLADYVFESDEEALKILLNSKFYRRKKINWPKEFNQKVVRRQYLSLMEELLDEK